MNLFSSLASMFLGLVIGYLADQLKIWKMMLAINSLIITGGILIIMDISKYDG